MSFYRNKVKNIVIQNIKLVESSVDETSITEEVTLESLGLDKELIFQVIDGVLYDLDMNDKKFKFPKVNLISAIIDEFVSMTP